MSNITYNGHSIEQLTDDDITRLSRGYANTAEAIADYFGLECTIKTVDDEIDMCWDLAFNID